mmetsp:Transcript_9659/g.17625  ORF Transcript_9659/g.17625 Transcript_9659/m.17625 type:complete len:229 (-) Transcript_9659:311-997(-)
MDPCTMLHSSGNHNPLIQRLRRTQMKSRPATSSSTALLSESLAETNINRLESQSGDGSRSGGSGGAAVPHSNHAASGLKKRTGVYFNNREVGVDSLHPSVVRYNIQVTSRIPHMPVGKPMPLPPKLKIQPVGMVLSSVIQGVVSSDDEADEGASESDEERLVSRKHSRQNEDKKEEQERPLKRFRNENKTSFHEKKTLSNEEKGFVEAALALSGSKNVMKENEFSNSK